jgi:hypothetical protein
MFSRIRYAAKVLTYSAPKVSRFDEPDIVFEDESRPEVTKLSKVIGSLVEILLVSVAIGLVSAPLVHGIFPAKERAGVATITGVIAALLAFLSQHFLSDLNNRIRLKLKIGEKLAPYLGHKILKTMHTLRG